MLFREGPKASKRQMNEVQRRGVERGGRRSKGRAAVRRKASLLASQLRFIKQGHDEQNRPRTAHFPASDSADASHPDGF